MNERDMALGRLVLQRNLCTREALQQAAAATQARRAQGEQVELVKVLVDLGAIGPDVARGLWAEVASLPTGPGAVGPGGAANGPSSGAMRRPVAPAAVAPPPAARPAPGPDDEFSPTATISTMGEPPPDLPAGYSPLGRASAPPEPAAAPGGGGLLDFTATPGAGGFGGSFAGSGAAGFAAIGRAGPRAAVPPTPPAHGYAPPPPTAFAPPPAAAPTDAFSPLMVDSGELRLGDHAFSDSGRVEPAAADFGPSALPPPTYTARGPARPGAPAAPLPAQPFPAAALPAQPPVSAAPVGASVSGAEPAAEEPAKKGKSGRVGPGAKSRRNRVGTASAGDRPARSGPTPLVIGLAVGAIVLVAIALGVAFSGGKAPAPAPAATPGPAPADTPATPPASGSGGTPARGDPAPPRPAGRGAKARTSEGFLVPPDRTPAKPEELDSLSEDHALEYLVRASDLADDQHDYAAALAMLNRYPEVLRGGSGYQRIQERHAAYTRFEGFERELKEALAEGKDSPKLRRLVARVEGGRLQTDLRDLPCTAAFEEQARRLLGDALYNEIGVPSMDLDVEPSGGSSD